MTIQEIKNTPEIVDFMLDKSVIADSRMKLHKRLEEICELAIKPLEQQPCEDCISRKDVHDMLENLPVTVENKWFNWLQKACIRLAELPSVTPKQQPCDDVEIKKIDEWEIQGKHAELWIVKGNLQVRYLGTIHNIPLPSVAPKEKTGHCKDCKWWKDNDGVYRRGIGAESKCPINSKKVYEGNGYCFMFEP